MFCADCGAPAPNVARFCSSCGAALAAAPIPSTEERRLVTVVFCDMVGSTALSGHLDPEVLRSVTLRYFDLMRASLQAHGGTVEKFIGDAVMAVFGVPQLHEDDARRALAATLDMTAALVQYNLELQVNLGIQLGVRIGVNTGEVIAVADPSANQALVSGEVVNIAARLEQNAAIDQILIGAATVQAAGRAAVVRAIGPLQLKGKDQPVPAYQLLELLADDPEVLRRFDVSFIGRDLELAELDLMLDRTLRRRRYHLLNLYGEAGIGKTRLVRTWQQSLNPQLVRLGGGRCRPYGDAGTLTALAEATTQLLEDVDTMTISIDALDLLRTGLLKDGTPNPSLSETVAALAAAVNALARDMVVVMVLDDCHWAPSVLLDLLDELAEQLDLEPVLLVCLARPELLDSRPSWGSGRLNANSMVLEGLSLDESAQLAAELVEVSAHDATTSGWILTRAEGNPLHLEHLLASLAEDHESRPLPPTVFALLAARIDALSGSERALLHRAAIIGREFDAADLASFSDDVDPHSLRGLIRRGLIEPLRDHGDKRKGYRFSSGLIQEVAYNGMSKRVRCERHQQFAESLRTRHNLQIEQAQHISLAATVELAGHLEHAYRYRAELGLLDTACEQLRTEAADQLGAAGTAALARADLCWADDLLSRAVALLLPNEPAWAPLVQRLADVLLARGSRDEGLRLLTDALETAAAAGDSRTVAHARLQLAVHDPAGYGNAADAARLGLTVFEDSDDQLGLARAGIRIAQELQLEGRHGDAEVTLLQAVQQAACADAEPERAMALGALGISLWRGPIPADVAIQRCQQLLAEHGPNRSTVRVTLNCPLAVLLALRGYADEAEQCLQLAEPLARSLGYAEVEAFMPLFAATVAAHAGDADGAERLLRQALKACDRLGAVGLVAAVSRELARNSLDRGLWHEAQSLITRLPPTRQNGSAQQLAPSEAADQLGICSRIEALRGNTALAAELAERASLEAARTDSPISQAVAALDRATVLVMLGDADAGRISALNAAHWFEQKQHLVGLRAATELARQIGTR